MSDFYQDEQREMGIAIKRELLCRCPRCGQGKLFRAFLKPVDTCAVCGEDYTLHGADDRPAYLSIVIVGHVAVGGLCPLTNWSRGRTGFISRYGRP